MRPLEYLGVRKTRRSDMTRSLLIAPTSGVTYGTHGVWDWSDGTIPAVGHEIFGIPIAWWDGLNFAGTNQILNLYHFFMRIPWWELLLAVEMVVSQM